MKKLVVFVAVAFVSFNATSQRNPVDAKNIEKTNEIHEKVVPLLTGHITNQHITTLGTFLYDNRPKDDRIRFMSLLNPYLFKMNEQRVIVDNTYITQAFRILQDKKDVKIILESVIDFYEELDPAYKKSAYTLSYIVSFK
ncbi:MAG: hypothetical protein ACKO7P_12185, partial [Bacteroidota bacterium]